MFHGVAKREGLELERQISLCWLEVLCFCSVAALTGWRSHEREFAGFPVTAAALFICRWFVLGSGCSKIGP